MAKPDCSELAQALTDLAMNIAASDPKGIGGIDDVVVKMQEFFPDIRRQSLVDAIVEATTGAAKTATETQKLLAAIKREAKYDTKLQGRIGAVEAALTKGDVLAPAKRPKTPLFSIATLRQTRDSLSRWMRTSNPAARVALGKRLDTLTAKIDAEDFAPNSPNRGALQAELQGIQDQIDKAKQTILDARSEKELIARRDELKEHLAKGTLPAPTREAVQHTPENQAVRDEIVKLRGQISKSDPAQQKRLQARIAALQAKLDAGDISAKPRTPLSQNAQTQKLQAEVDNLNKAIQEKRTLAALEAKAKELHGFLGAGTLPAGAAKPKATTPAVEAARGLVKELRSRIAQSDPAVAARLQKQIAQMEALIASGNFGQPVSKPSLVRSKAVERLQYQRDRLRNQIRSEIQDLKPTTIWQKITSPFQTARILMTTGEMSYVLRQGGFFAMGHPIKAMKAFGTSLRAFASEQQAYRIQQEIENHELAPLAARAKLHISPMDGTGKLSKMEEIYMGKIAGKIPGLANFQRAGVIFLNKLRIDHFELLVNSLAGGEPTQAQAEALAMLVNESTGRGGLGKAEPIAVGLNTVLFAPRYVTSRFQMLALHSMWRGDMQTRKIIAKEYARYLIGLAVMYGLAALAGFKVGVDPRSPDFGKIIIGDTRIDPLSGLSQAVVFVSRMISGQTASSTGKVSDIRGEVKYGKTTAVDVMARFARSKASPMIGTAIDLASGTDYMGKPVTPRSMTKMLYPITYGDIAEQFVNEKIPQATAVSLLAFLGEGVQRYEQQKSKSKMPGGEPKEPPQPKQPPQGPRR
jgi:hypothetical protein